MSKILINPSTTTTVKIASEGINIRASDSYDIPFDSEGSFAINSEIIGYITAGTLLVSDGTTTYTDVKQAQVYFQDTFGGRAVTSNSSGTLSYFDNIIATDPNTGIVLTTCFYDLMSSQRELFNATTNPLYDPTFIPLLGEGGTLENLTDRTNNLETILGKNGFYTIQTQSYEYLKPKDLLIYYGWLNSFNSATNGWSNEKVAQDMAKYRLIVFGDGLEAPTHGDYANTQIIIPRIQQYDPLTNIFGYVAATNTFADFQSKVDEWNTLAVNGIFIDTAGYDFGITRVQQNQMIDYVHSKTHANLVFINAFDMDHVCGTVNDPSFPNTTFNPSAVVTNLTNTDWYLAESFAVNTDAYTGSGAGGHAFPGDWATRGVRANTYRSSLGINVASVGIIDNADANGQALFNFSFTSALMFSFEAHGTSDSSYASGSASVQFWTRPSVAGMTCLYSLGPSVQQDTGNLNLYHRYAQFGHMIVDYTSGAQTSSITIY